MLEPPVVSASRPPLRFPSLSLSPRHRVFAAFFLYAFGFGGFFPRLAELQRGLHAREGELGLALIGTAAGTLVSLSLGARVTERWGHRRVLLSLLPAIAAFYGLAARMDSPLAVFLCLVPAGLAIGLVEIIVNLEADRIEHHNGRRLMNRAHAFWSFGFFGAGLVGALLARLGVSPQMHLAAVVPLTVALTAWLLGDFQPAPHRTTAGGDTVAPTSPRLARPTVAILTLVALAVSAMVLEGASFDWSAIYMRDVFTGNAVLGGAAVATGAFTQALTRFVIDRPIERLGTVVVARTLLVLLGLGCALVTWAPVASVALIGFALMGVGTSAIFPLAMSATAQRTDRPAALNVAAFAQTSFLAFLLAPPLLGLVAQHWGIRAAFGLGLPLVALSLAVSGALAPSTTAALQPRARTPGAAQ